MQFQTLKKVNKKNHWLLIVTITTICMPLYNKFTKAVHWGLFLFLYVRLWRRPSVCPSLVDRTDSPRILQLGTFDQHGEKKIDFQARSEVKVKVGKHSRIIQLATIDHDDKCKMLIVYQGQRSTVKVVLSH